MRALALPLAAAIALAVAACGGDAAEGTSLTVVYWEDGDRPAESETWTLSCDPAAGTHPDPVAACAAVAAAGPSAFEPVPDDRACTEIFGGPQRAEVTGTVDGEEVAATFTRANGCEIERWDALAGLLPGV